MHASAHDGNRSRVRYQPSRGSNGRRVFQRWVPRAAWQHLWLVLAGNDLDVLRFRQMSKTITIRLNQELAEWLDQASKQSGIPRGRIIREQLEKARDSGKEPSFMRLAGTVRGARDLSLRKGFYRP